MPIKKLALILTAFASLLIANTSEARLGWTLAECEAHYGKSTSRLSIDADGIVYDFTVGNIRITATLGVDNVVSRIEYWKLDYSNWTLDEVKTLLEKNKGNCIWDYDYPTKYNDTRMAWDASYLGVPRLTAIWFKDDTKQPARWYLSVLTYAQLFIDGAHQQEKAGQNLNNL